MHGGVGRRGAEREEERKRFDIGRLPKEFPKSGSQRSQDGEKKERG